MKNLVLATSLITTSLLISGCAPKLGGHDYNVKGVGEVSKTLKGVIIGARSVMINAHNNSQMGAGAAIGGISGALLGSQIGGGRGQILTGVLGGLLGGGAGHLAEGHLQNQEGMEYQVQLHNGEVITLSQGAEPKMSVGQRILVIESNRDRSRIVPDLSHS